MVFFYVGLTFVFRGIQEQYDLVITQFKRELCMMPLSTMSTENILTCDGEVEEKVIAEASGHKSLKVLR